MSGRAVCRALLAIALVKLLALIVPGSSEAGVCDTYLEERTRAQLKADVAAELKQAVAVFTGTVTTLDQFAVRMRVDRIWKGRIGRTVAFSTGTRKTANGRLSSGSEDYAFDTGAKYVVFAMGKSLHDMQAYQCGNTGPLKDATATLTFLDELTVRR